MTAYYPRKEETLTAKNIVDSYTSAYESVFDHAPQCAYLDRGIFWVNGIERDRRWMVLEVERLRQEALTKALSDTNLSSKPRGNLFRLIRRLSKI